MFSIYNKDSLNDLEKYLIEIKSKEYKAYLVGYDKELSENKADEFNYIDKVEELTKKYGCEFEYVTMEDIYKVKTIIIDNIGKYFPN